MSSNYLYSNTDYAASRLDQTVITKGDRAVFVERVKADNTIDFRFLGEDLLFNKPLTYEEGFSYSDFNIGYMNRDRGTMFYQRPPLRRWKQGLDARSLGFNMRKELLTSKDMENMLCNKYPSISKAVEAVREGLVANSRAFHRDFAAVESRYEGLVDIEYRRQKRIATIHPDTLEIKKFPNSKYLRPYLEEVLNENNS